MHRSSAGGQTFLNVTGTPSDSDNHVPSRWLWANTLEDELGDDAVDGAAFVVERLLPDASRALFSRAKGPEVLAREGKGQEVWWKGGSNI